MMKLHLKKTSIALAVAAVSGVVFSAPVTTVLTQTATDAVLGNNYQQTAGSETSDAVTGTYVSQKDIATGAIVSSSTPVVDGPEVQIGGINYRNYTYQEIRKGTLEARNEKNTTATVNGTQTDTASWNTTTATGQATRTAKTHVELDKTINPATEKAGTKERLDDTTFSFAADNVNTVVGAHTTSNAGSLENVNYAAADERSSSDKYSNTTSDLTTEAKLGADGKPIVGQTIRVGTVENKYTENNVYYKSTTDANGIKTSKNANGLLSSEEWSSAQHSVSTNYQHKDNDPAKDVVAFNLSADKKTVLESTVNTNKSASSSKEVDYDDVNAAGLDYTSEYKWSHDNAQESLLDGFVSVDKGSYETSETQYNQAALGTSNALASIESTKSSSETKSRDFVKNAAGEIVLTNGKPTVNTETEIKNNNENYDSVYQPTRYKANDVDKGITKGDAYNTKILNDGTPTIWTDTNVQKSTSKGATSKVVTHKQDGNFQEHWNTAWDNSTTYARNSQENIEVNRDIKESFTTDEKTLNKAYKVGEVVTKAGENDQFALGTVRVNDNGEQYDGRLIAQGGDVHTWKDETGKDRYYVVIGHDANGEQIRSEVTFKNGKPAETKDILVDVVNTKVTENKRTDKVTMGEEVAYNTNSSIKNETATTSRDGKIIYDSNKFNETTDKKVYSIGKNALDYQKVVDGSEETVHSNYELDNTNNVVVTSVDTSKDTWKNTTQQFQPGQEKSLVNSSLASWNDTRTAGGKEVAYNRGNNESTFTQYNEGKNALDRTTVSKEVGESKILGQQTISTDIRPVNEDGDPIHAGGVLATDEQGNAVLSKAKDTVASVDFDKVTKTTDNVDEKVFQTGTTAYSKVASDSADSVITYADKSTGYEKTAHSSDVKLYNHGASDKYRDFTSSESNSSKHNDYTVNAQGQAVLSGTTEKSDTTDRTEVNYQAGKNALEKSTKKVETNAETTVASGKTTAVKGSKTTDTLNYQKGQELTKSTTRVEAEENKVTNADNTGRTYTEAKKFEDKEYSSVEGLLATGQVKRSIKHEDTETLVATGKDKVSITRGGENVWNTDHSSTETTYGSETTTAASGATTTVAKKAVDVADKFGTFESSTLSRTETKVATDKSSTSNTKTRVDSVDGIVLTATQTNTDVAGKAVTSSRTTSLNADGLTTDRITLNGKDLQTELNRMGNNVDEVQRKAYRGIAIALAAQQAVPNIGPGQVAVFGGVGHYEGETAGSIGVVTSFTDRISASGAFGFAGGNEFGGRVGIAYVFGGK